LREPNYDNPTFSLLTKGVCGQLTQFLPIVFYIHSVYAYTNFKSFNWHTFSFVHGIVTQAHTPSTWGKCLWSESIPNGFPETTFSTHESRECLFEE